MSLVRCPQCKHGNPAGSKFCSACGVALDLPPYLASCPRCGTVNPVKATVCCWCRGQLPGRRSLPRRRTRAIVGTAVFAAAAVLGYLAYRQHWLDDALQPPAVARDAKSAGADRGAGLIGPASSTSGLPPAVNGRAAANPPGSGRPPVQSQEGKATAAAVLRPQAANAGRAGERGLSHQEECTEAVATLGLCAMRPVQTEPTRSRDCTEAVAALGLCPQRPTQRSE